MKKLGSRQMPVLVAQEEDPDEARRKVAGRALVARLKGQAVHCCPFGHIHSHASGAEACKQRALYYIARVNPTLTTGVQMYASLGSARAPELPPLTGEYPTMLALFGAMRERRYRAIKARNHQPACKIAPVDEVRMGHDSSLITVLGGVSQTMTVSDIIRLAPLEALEAVFRQWVPEGADHPACRELTRRLRLAGFRRQGDE